LVYCTRYGTSNPESANTCSNFGAPYSENDQDSKAIMNTEYTTIMNASPKTELHYDIDVLLAHRTSPNRYMDSCARFKT
jgi:hypothetical protein